MNPLNYIKELPGILKAYLIAGSSLVGFYSYSDYTGFKWFNPTTVERESAGTGTRTGYYPGFYRSFHK